MGFPQQTFRPVHAVRSAGLALAMAMLIGHPSAQDGGPAPVQSDSMASPARADLGGGASRPDSHHLVLPREDVRRREVTVAAPHTLLLREDGQKVMLDELLHDNRPVYVDFIYTTCTAVCPIMSGAFESLLQSLGAHRDDVQLVSISIDPEEDTPRRLREYRSRFDTGNAWHFYTGTVDASQTAQRAFGVFTGDKMLHEPVTLFRPAPGKPWVRFDGFVSPQDLVREWRGAPLAIR